MCLIQFVRGEELKERAQNQWTSDIPVGQTRTIYDRNKNHSNSATVDPGWQVQDIDDLEKLRLF